MSKLLLARVLVDALIGDKPCMCNELVEHQESVIKKAVKDGVADSSKAAVDYLKEQGVEPRSLVDAAESNDDPVTADQLVIVIEQLDKDKPELWTEQGLPKTETLETATGKSVSAELRDEAFALYQESLKTE